MFFWKIIFQNRYVELETPPPSWKKHLKLPFWLFEYLPNNTFKKNTIFLNNSDFLFSNILTILDDFGRLRVMYHFQSRRLVMTQGPSLGGVYSAKIEVWNRQNSVASTENPCLCPSLDQTACHVMLLLLRDGWRHQTGWIFGKAPKGFQSKKLYFRFETFKQGFLSMKLKKYAVWFYENKGGGVKGSLGKFIRFGTVTHP